MWQPSASHFAGIMQRIEEADSKASVISANHQLKKRGGLLHRIIEAFSSVPRGLQWTMAFETVACFGLLLALAISVNNPAVFSSRFETLSDQEKPLDIGGNALRVVFADDLTTLELASLLKQVNGQIRQGPSAVGAYVVEVSATAPEKAMEILRADPKVRLAQPITGDSAE
jgi:hypothetical protein